MQKFITLEPVETVIQGRFYCGFDTISRQIRFTVEATSGDEAQKRMATVAPLIGITKDEKFFFVVLEEAPQGVPTFLRWFFAFPKDHRGEPIQLHST